MKKNLEILDFENKSTKAMKPFVRFKTSSGWMSCFDLKECEKIKKLHEEGKMASVEVIESVVDAGKENETRFNNIRKCYGAVTSETTESEETKEEFKVEKVPPVSNNKQQRTNGDGTHLNCKIMCAKDVFCAMIAKETWTADCEESMDLAIKLVKQAKEAFE